jgi:hypothetical protein
MKTHFQMSQEKKNSGRECTTSDMLPGGRCVNCGYDEHPAPAVKRWLGPAPTHCDVCSGTLGAVFYDGATKGGPWGILCHACCTYHGRGLGAGRGQKYNRKTLEKTGG